MDTYAKISRPVTAILERVMSSVQKIKVRSSDWSSTRQTTRVCRLPTQMIRWVLTVHVIPLFLLIWGVFILVCHFQAKHVANTASPTVKVGCKLHNRPWLATKYSCAVLEINCYRRQIVGTAQDIDKVLTLLDPNGMSMLVISHCPRLSIPPRLQLLRELEGLEIYNTTLVSWPAHSALTEAHHPSILYVGIVKTDFNSVPEGLLADDFPHRLHSIMFAYSNLTSLPSDLHLTWSRVINMVVEHTQLTEVPTTLAHMRPDRLSLLDNQLHHIPDDLFTIDDFYVVSVARNPISQLPQSLGKLTQMQMLVIDDTFISELSTAVIEEGHRRHKTNVPSLIVSAGGTPLCHNRLNITSDVDGLKVVCRHKQDFEIEGYPMDYNSHFRQP